jgi:ferritin-like metal-binding protein YciE
MDEAVQLLEETLEEEKKTDALLTEMAESTANPEAESGEEEEETPKRRAKSR